MAESNEETILVALHPNNLPDVEAERVRLEVEADDLEGTKVIPKAHCAIYKGHLAIINPEKVWYTKVYEPGEYTILAGELEDQA